jgi:hypothetical protein
VTVLPRYYKPPRPDPIRLLLVTSAAVVVAMLVGVVYAMVQTRVDSLYVRVGMTFGLAGAVSFVTVGAVRIAHLHRRVSVLSLAGVLSLAALWAAWVVWVRHVMYAMGLDVPLVRLAINPTGLYRVIMFINEMGVWTWEQQLYRGPKLLLVWMAEAVIVVCGSVAIAVKVVEPGLFCAACNTACNVVPRMPRFDASDTSEVRQRVESGDFAYLLQLGPTREPYDPEIQVQLLRCPCGQTNVLNVNRVAWVDDGKGALDTQRTPLVRGLLLDVVQVEEFRALMEAARAREVDDNQDEGDDEVNDDADVVEEPQDESETDPYAPR